MGGGGDYYDRDVTYGASRTRSGFSSLAEEKLSRKTVNSAVLPKNRRLTSTCRSPFIYGFDVTGSMGDLPKVIFDKMPMIAGQLVMQKYLDDPMISLAAVGDAECDDAPVQVCDFSKVKSLDEWLERLWLEGGGGGQARESYELTAYFYARCYDMKGAQTPILLFTGDEGFRDTLPAGELKDHFGGTPESVDAKTVFNELKKKFKGNVFVLFPTFTNSYSASTNRENLARWRNALGEENVIVLDSKVAIADVTLGIIAIASGSRTLEEYIRDIKERPLEMDGKKFEPQSEERINEVRKALGALAKSRNALTGTARRPKGKASPPKKGKKGGRDKPGSKSSPDYKL